MYYYLFVLQAGFTDGALGLESGRAQGRVADPDIMAESGFGFIKGWDKNPNSVQSTFIYRICSQCLLDKVKLK